MDKPNDIDYAIVDAKLDGLREMFVAASHAYRTGLIDTLCRFAREFVPGVASVRLMADVDWRWGFEAWLDDAGEEIDHDFGDDFYFEDLFTSADLSELDDLGPRASYGYVHVAERVFVAEPLAQWRESQSQ